MFHTPVFKAHLRVDVAPPDLVFVSSEAGDSVLRGRLLPLLAPLLDGTNTLADIHRHLAGEATALDIHFGLSLLADDGLIVEADETPAAELAAFRDALAIEPAAFRRRLAAASVAVSAHGSVPREPFVDLLRSLGLGVADDGSLAVVLVEDYLDPALAAFDRRARARGRPWMLVKPVGLIPWVGPVFPPQGSGCWACLAHRLEENRPFRPLLETRRRSAGPLPAATLASTIHFALGAAANQVLRWAGEGENPALERTLVALDARTLVATPHRFPPRHHCPVCGEPPPEPDRVPAPIRLRPRRKSLVVDGGYRTAAPAATFRQLEHLVSPVTGIVSRIRPRHLGPVEVYLADHLFRSEPDDRKALAGGLTRTSAGKGIGPDQARTSALCEALERYSGIFRGDEARKTARLSELDGDAVHPNACMNYSGRQLRQRDAWNCRNQRYLWVPRPFDEERAIEWTPLWSLTAHRFRYLPTGYCYYAYPMPEDHDFCFADSNGNAAGTCLEEAILQGFLELAERDCVAIWWYNRVPRPGVALDSFGQPLFAHLADLYRELGRELWVLDLTNDLGIPAFAAVSRKLGSTQDGLILGFGAHLEPGIAVARAVTEMGQFLPGWLEGRPRRLLSDDLADISFLAPDAAQPPKRAEDFPGYECDDLRAAVERCVELARRLGLETLVLDQTRPEVGLRVVKVVVPGLRHFWARLGPGRLYEVPLRLGWLESPRCEEDLNPAHLLI